MVHQSAEHEHAPAQVQPLSLHTVASRTDTQIEVKAPRPLRSEAYCSMPSHALFTSLTYSDDLWWVTAPLPVPFFDGRALPFNFTVDPEGEAWDAAQDAALTFLNLKAKAREHTTPHVLADLRFSLEVTSYGDEEYEQDMAAIDTSEALWAQVTPKEVWVVYPSIEPETPYVLVCTEPSWEQEHGLQLVLRRGHELVCLMPNEPDVPELTDSQRQGVVRPPLDLKSDQSAF